MDAWFACYNNVYTTASIAEAFSWLYDAPDASACGLRLLRGVYNILPAGATYVGIKTTVHELRRRKEVAIHAVESELPALVRTLGLEENFMTGHLEGRWLFAATLHDARKILILTLPRDGSQLFAQLGAAVETLDLSIRGTPLIVSEFPFFEWSWRVSRRCNHCGNGGRVKACTRCQTALYCGVECQKASWRAHRPVCTALRALSP